MEWMEQTFGMGNWDSKQKVLQTMYGINVESPTTLMEIWQHLCYRKHIQLDVETTIKYGIMYKGVPQHYVQAIFKQYGEYWSVQHIVNVFHKGVKQVIKQLILLFSKNKIRNQMIFDRLSPETIRALFKMGDSKPNGQLAQDIVVSSKLLGVFILVYYQNNGDNLNRSELYSEFYKIAPRHKIIRILEHLKYLNVLVKIQNKGYYDDMNIIGKSIHHAPTLNDNRQSEVYQLLYGQVNTDLVEIEQLQIQLDEQATLNSPIPIMEEMEILTQFNVKLQINNQV